MSLSTPEYFLFFYLAPVALLVSWFWLRVYRGRKVLAAANTEVERAGASGDAAKASAKAFGSKPDKTPDALLRRYALPQQTYLRQQCPLAKFGFCFCAYVVLIAACSGLLPQNIQDGAGTSAAQKLIQSYRTGLATASYLAAVLSFFTALIAVSTLQTGTAVFPRTRPLPLAFLFRARVWSALVTLFAAVTAAVVLSNLPLLAMGWHLGPDAIDGRALLAADLTVPLFAIVSFSAVAMLGSLSFGRKANGTGRLPKLLPILIGGAVGGNIVPFLRSMQAKGVDRAFAPFGNASFASGIAIVAGWVVAAFVMLALAERLSARIEL